MRYRGVGAVALATTLLFLPGTAWGQMGPGMGRGMGRETERGGEPGATRQLAPPPSRQSEAIFLLLVAAAGASGGVVTYRLTRGRWRRGDAAATFVTEAVLVVDLIQSTHLATHYGDGLAMKARTALRDRTLALAKAHGLVFGEHRGRLLHDVRLGGERDPDGARAPG